MYMRTIIINESDIRRIVRSVLNEGYSGKHFDSQIRDIANEFMEYKDAVDCGNIRNLPQYYTISISLRPFFGNQGDAAFDNDYSIKITYRRNEPGGIIGGSYNPFSLQNNRRYNIEVRTASDVTYNDIYVTLLHEVTHLVDDLIKNQKGHKSGNFPYTQMKIAEIPDCIRRILYMLWGSSEFNAWQSSYKHIAKNVDITEWAIRKLREAYSINDEETWDKVKLYVALQKPNLNIHNKSAMEFKNYFIKTSFKLIKKMVKKYY